MKSLKKALALVFMSLTLVFAATVVVNTANPVTVEAATSKATLKKKCDAVINAQVKTTDTKATKLKKLFTYMRKNYKYQGFCSKHPVPVPSLSASAKKTWTTDYAYCGIANKKGNCYHFAAAYAALAERATGYKTRVVTGKTVGFDKARKAKNAQPHAWVEIKISDKWYIFDVNLDQLGKTTTGKTVAANTYYKKLRTGSTMKKIYCDFKKADIKNYYVDL